MKDRVQGCVTAGVALVGAGVMAAAPVAQQAPEVLRSVNADVALAAAYEQPVAELFALSAQRTVTGLASTPVGFATAAIALAQGQNNVAAAILKEIVDGPQWAADPAIYALDDLLPEPIGGDDANEPTEPDADSAISQFRADVLIAARDDVNEAIADSLGLGTQPDVDDEGPVYAVARLGAAASPHRASAPQVALSQRRSASWPSRRGCSRVSKPETTRRCTPPSRGVHRRTELCRRSDRVRGRRRPARAHRKRPVDRSNEHGHQRDIEVPRQHTIGCEGSSAGSGQDSA